MNKVSVSAPGKINIMGEHAVVYGKPSLLTAINRRTVVTVNAIKSGYTFQSDSGDRLPRESVRVVEQHLKTKVPPFSMSVSSSIPSGYHLGSSGAVSVASVGALLYFSKKIWNPDVINSLAYEVEKVQHGTPSGGDNTTSTHGGFIWFRKELEFLKTVWQIPLKPITGINLYLVNTGKPYETTGEMVSLVRDFITANPKKAREILDTNEEATKRVASAFKNNNKKDFIHAICDGEKTLEALGAVSKQVIPFVRIVEKQGGAVKILGGGGRKGPVGYLLAIHQSRSVIEKIASEHHYGIEDVQLGEEGVKLERSE